MFTNPQEVVQHRLLHLPNSSDGEGRAHEQLCSLSPDKQKAFFQAFVTFRIVETQLVSGSEPGMVNLVEKVARALGLPPSDAAAPIEVSVCGRDFSVMLV